MPDNKETLQTKICRQKSADKKTTDKNLQIKIDR